MAGPESAFPIMKTRSMYGCPSCSQKARNRKRSVGLQIKIRRLEASAAAS